MWIHSKACLMLIFCNWHALCIPLEEKSSNMEKSLRRSTHVNDESTSGKQYNKVKFSEIRALNTDSMDSPDTKSILNQSEPRLNYQESGLNYKKPNLQYKESRLKQKEHYSKYKESSLRLKEPDLKHKESSLKYRKLSFTNMEPSLKDKELSLKQTKPCLKQVKKEPIESKSNHFKQRNKKFPKDIFKAESKSEEITINSVEKYTEGKNNFQKPPHRTKRHLIDRMFRRFRPPTPRSLGWTKFFFNYFGFFQYFKPNVPVIIGSVGYPYLTMYDDTTDAEKYYEDYYIGNNFS